METRLTTDQKIPGSTPGRLEFFNFWLFYFLIVLTWAQTIFSNAQKEKEKTEREQAA